MTRDQVVTEARSWIGTPFHHQGRLKGVGVDCAGLIIGVSRALGLLDPSFDVIGYPRSPDGTSLLEHSDSAMRRIARDDMAPGDVIVIRWDRWPQHFGLLADYRHGGLSMIHAYAPPGSKGKVIEHRLAPQMLEKFVAAYALPGVT